MNNEKPNNNDENKNFGGAPLEGDLSKNLELYMILLMPYIYGNPGNATVMSKLMEIKSNVYMAGAEEAFRKKYPKHKDELGWLWVIYKMCDKDIQKTDEFLHNLFKKE